jgi:hypothetical protein
MHPAMQAYIKHTDGYWPRRGRVVQLLPHDIWVFYPRFASLRIDCRRIFPDQSAALRALPLPGELDTRNSSVPTGPGWFVSPLYPRCAPTGDVDRFFCRRDYFEVTPTEGPQFEKADIRLDASLRCASSSHPLHNMEASRGSPPSAGIRKRVLRGLHLPWKPGCLFLTPPS